MASACIHEEVPAALVQTSNVEHQRILDREGSALQRVLSSGLHEGAGLGSRKSGLAASRSLAHTVSSGPAPAVEDIPPLAIVMLVCGTRGDVQVGYILLSAEGMQPSLQAAHEAERLPCLIVLQPFLALGIELKRYGHRVRLATHKSFKDLVLEHGLDFYPLGGDPQQLSAYMVGMARDNDCFLCSMTCVQPDLRKPVAGGEQGHRARPVWLPAHPRAAAPAKGGAAACTTL